MKKLLVALAAAALLVPAAAMAESEFSIVLQAARRSTPVDERHRHRRRVRRAPGPVPTPMLGSSWGTSARRTTSAKPQEGRLASTLRRMKATLTCA